MRTLQEWFDLAYLGVQSQGFTQSKHTHFCRYKSGPRCCAIGWGLPAEFRAEADKASMELGQILKTLKEDLDLEVMLVELQGCHDGGYSPEYMQDLFFEFACKYSLTVPLVRRQPTLTVPLAQC